MTERPNRRPPSSEAGRRAGAGLRTAKGNDMKISDLVDRLVETDREYKDGTIASVREGGDGYEVTLKDSWSLWVSPKPDPPPRVGDAIRLYTSRITCVRGIFINGKKIRYQTAEEYRAEELRRLAADKEERRITAEACREETDRRIAALPEPLRRRLAGFRTRKADFDSECMPYELMCCEQAVILADRLKTVESLAEFRSLPWEKQREAIPELDEDHSGNSFGFACRLAYHLLTDPENVVREHGAMCVLVGCKDYGCQYGTKEAT